MHDDDEEPVTVVLHKDRLTAIPDDVALEMFEQSPELVESLEKLLRQHSSDPKIAEGNAAQLLAKFKRRKLH